jgi:hypothetical protein
MNADEIAAVSILGIVAAGCLCTLLFSLWVTRHPESDHLSEILVDAIPSHR